MTQLPNSTMFMTSFTFGLHRLACNYDPSSTYDGSPAKLLMTATAIAWPDADGICDELKIAGCTTRRLATTQPTPTTMVRVIIARVQMPRAQRLSNSLATVLVETY